MKNISNPILSAVLATVLSAFLIPASGLIVRANAEHHTEEAERTSQDEHAKSQKQAYADLKDAQGKKVGRVLFTELSDGVEIKVTARGLTPGSHGIHIHSVGKCEGPEFKSAGSHYSTEGGHHGLNNPQGPHAGDLPNLEVDAKGNAKAVFTDKHVTLRAGAQPLLKDGGTSIVIHAKADDQKSDPAGDSGARIACGVIKDQSNK